MVIRQGKASENKIPLDATCYSNSSVDREASLCHFNRSILSSAPWRKLIALRGEKNEATKKRQTLDLRHLGSLYVPSPKPFLGGFLMLDIYFLKHFSSGF